MKFKSLATKIWLTLTIAISLSAAVTAYYITQNQRKILLKSKSDQLEELLNTLALSVQISFDNDQYKGLSKTIEFLKRIDEHEFTSIFLLDSLNQEQLFITYPRFVPKEKVLSFQKNFLSKEKIIESKGLKIKVVTSFKEDVVLAQIEAFNNKILMLIFAFYLLNIIVVFIVAKKIVDPIVFLTNYVSKMSEGIYPEKLNISRSSDELGVLKNSIVWLEKEIIGEKKRNQELNYGLESKVRSRTLELENTMLNLEANQFTLKKVIDSAFDAIVVADQKGFIVNWNKAAIEIFGYEENEAIGKRISDLIVPDDFKDSHNKGWARYLATGENRVLNKKLELKGKTKNNEIIDIEMFITSVSIKNQYLFSAFIKDITKQKEIENRIKESQLIITNILDTLPINISLKDKNHKYILANKFLLNSFNTESIVGKTDYDLHPITTAEALIAEDIEIMQNGNQLKITEEEHILNNEKKYLLAGKKIIKFYSESLESNDYLLSFSFDISDRKEAEKKILYYSLMLELLLHISTDYINSDIHKIDELIQEGLEKIGSFVGADRAYVFDYDLIAKTASNTFEWCSEGVESEINNLQGVPIEFFDPWYEKHKNGDYFYIHNVQLLPDEGPNSIRGILEPQGIISILTVPMIFNKKLLGFVGFDFVKSIHNYDEKEKNLLTAFGQMLVNINERILISKKLIKEKETAEKANKAKSEFLANMSHEIRTPLHSIIGISDIVKEKINPEDKDLFKSLISSSEHLLALINDILDFSKLQSNESKLHFSEINLNEFLNKLYHQIHTLANKKSIQLNIPQVSDDICISFDETKLYQVLINLLSNAVKFTEKGHVSCITKIKNLKNNLVSIRFIVEDTGVGIGKEKISQITKPFVQANSGISKTYGGTGLGLSIVTKILEHFESKLDIKSKKNVGSTFSFTIHAKTSANKKSPTETPQKSLDLKKSYNLLYVEDNYTNQLLFKAMLSDYKLINLTILDSGYKAIDLTEKEKFDLIFMDIQMPEINGIETMKIIRNSNNLNKSSKIVAFTANVSEEQINNFLTYGFNDVVTKPITKNTLINKIEAFLKND